MVHGFGLLRRGAMLSALALLPVSTALAAGSGTQTTPTLKISGVPASVKEGSSFSVTASGYSGKFSELVVFPLVTAACKSTWGGESGQHALYSESPNHNYKTTAHIYLYRYSLGRTPGTYHFCVYLAKGPTGMQLHRSVTYQVTA